MKITKNDLKKLIKEELQKVAEVAGPVSPDNPLVAVAKRQLDSDIAIIYNWLRDDVSSYVADNMPDLPLVDVEK